MQSKISTEGVAVTCQLLNVVTLLVYCHVLAVFSVAFCVTAHRILLAVNIKFSISSFPGETSNDTPETFHRYSLFWPFSHSVFVISFAIFFKSFFLKFGLIIQNAPVLDGSLTSIPSNHIFLMVTLFMRFVVLVLLIFFLIFFYFADRLVDLWT